MGEDFAVEIVEGRLMREKNTSLVRKRGHYSRKKIGT